MNTLNLECITVHLCTQEIHHVELRELTIQSRDKWGTPITVSKLLISGNCVSTDFFFSSSHGMSYPISGLVKTYKAKEYNVDHPLVVKIFNNKLLS